MVEIREKFDKIVTHKFKFVKTGYVPGSEDNETEI